jgi:hypothetical protein
MKRCPIGALRGHDEQIRIVIGNAFAGISISVYVNHLRPVVAGGGVMSDFWKDYEPEPTRPAPMTKDEALDLALEALIYASSYCDTYDAITAIKQARSAPVQELPVFGPPIGILMKMEGDETRKLYPLKQKPAPVQEKWGASAVMNPDYVAAQKEKTQQALDVMAENARELGLGYEPAPGYCQQCKQYSIEEPLPAAQRQWVGLTDEEIDKIVWNLPYEPDKKDIRAIEAKLKEKNT